MTEVENYISVFTERRNPENGKTLREPIGDFPICSDKYTLPDGRKVRLDISKLNQSRRGPKLIGVEIDDLGFKEVGLKRLTARGYQVIAPDLRIGVEVYNPKGITRR